MELWIDGGCRHNGYANAVAATAVVQVFRRGRNRITQTPFHDNPTSQRAELAAAIQALQLAIEKQQSLGGDVYMLVTIHTDSRYLYKFETDWYDKWEKNGWLNARGQDVVNQDLMKEALSLESTIRRHGQVTWKWVPRGDNEAADEAVNDELDDMERYGWGKTSSLHSMLYPTVSKNSFYSDFLISHTCYAHSFLANPETWAWQ